MNKFLGITDQRRYTGFVLGYAISFEIPNWVVITSAALILGVVIVLILARR